MGAAKKKDPWPKRRASVHRRAMLVCALVALAMPAVAAQCCAERPLDLVIAVDRSKSVKKSQWNDFVIPSLNAMLSGAIDWTEQPGKPLRVSLIVYPGENG